MTESEKVSGETGVERVRRVFKQADSLRQTAYQVKKHIEDLKLDHDFRIRGTFVSGNIKNGIIVPALEANCLSLLEQADELEAKLELI